MGIYTTTKRMAVRTNTTENNPNKERLRQTQTQKISNVVKRNHYIDAVLDIE